MSRGGRVNGNPKMAHQKYFIAQLAQWPVKMVKYSDIVKRILKPIKSNQ